MLMVWGILLGVFSGTVTESFFHKLFGHPSQKLVRFYFRFRKVFAACLKPYFQHLVIHHRKNYLNHFFSQFDSTEHKAEVDDWIQKNFDKSFAELIWIERYNLTLKGFVGTLPFAGPFCLGPIIIGITLGPDAFVGSLFTAYIPVWLSKYIHPLIHQPHETYLHGPLIRWIMKTKYAEKVLLNHFLHHQSEGTNFNLLLGGDYLLGLHRKPTPEEAIEYEELLKEFRVKVRLTGSEKVPKSSSQSLTLIRNISPELVKSSHSYFNLERPNYEERIQFQKLCFPETNNDSIRSLEFENFGLGLFDKGLCYKSWSFRKEFSQDSYDWDGDTVVYRGTKFKSGDILLTNQDSDSDGLFSTLLEQQINFSHAAIYVTLLYRGKKIPTVIEMNEDGIRSVPLKALLSKKFNRYVEVFRYDRASEVNLDDFSRAAIETLDETHAFDIFQDRSQADFLNCSRTIEHIYGKVGFPLQIGESRYHTATVPNLFTLGIDGAIGKNLLMPDDFALSDNFKLTGYIANGNYLDVLSRNMVREYYQEVWRSMDLNPSLFPFSFHLNSVLIRLIQKRNWLSRAILFSAGMKLENFPSGPIVFLSLVKHADDSMKSAVGDVRSFFHENWGKYSESTWQEIRSSREVKSILSEATAEFRTIFSDRSRGFAESKKYVVKKRKAILLNQRQ